MLSHNMRESRTGRIELPDTSRKSMRVFLRMLYTGQVDPRDWQASGEHTASTCLELPMPILLDIARLSKKYMVSDTLEMCIDVLKKRLVTAVMSKEVSTFENIFVASLAMDATPLNLAALDAAREFDELHSQYQSRNLSPEVLHALQA